MNTAERLEALTDRSKFELLATSVLHKDNRDYSAILHSGVNAHGESIKSPVDGFCQVPGSISPQFLLVEHTTTDKRGLEKKWLHDHSTTKSRKASNSEDGDLLKAGREAQKLRQYFLNARFTIILTTNQRLGYKLQTEVLKKAQELGVEVDFWDQSRLADFLDSTSEGQWLRKEYLGIEAEMLSTSLLRRICEQSLVNYKRQFLTCPDSWITRELDNHVDRAVNNTSYTIQLLVGESGSGKSAIAYQVGRKHFASGGYSLWASDELLRGCDSLEMALDRILRNLYPKLLPDAGRTALQLVPKNSKLFLIIDDIHRADDSTRLLQKLVNWSKPQRSDPSELQFSSLPCLIICPVWSKVASSVTPDFSKTSWIGNNFVDSMNSTEGAVAIQALASSCDVEITRKEAKALAGKLGNDPILIGLFGARLTNVQVGQLNNLAENIIEKFITQTIDEAASEPSARLSIEYQTALSNLTSQMLTSRKLYPLWKELQDWFSNSPDETALRELVKHGELCRLEGERFVFRHDRIRNVLLVRSMIELLAGASNLDVFWEPFYAEIMGQAIVRSPQPPKFLHNLCDQLPLALVEAVRCFGTPRTDYHEVLISQVKEWMDTSIANDSILGSVREAVCWSLLETDSSSLLEITQKFPRNPLILLARLRNGCTISGIQFLSYVSREDTVITTTDDLREQVLNHVKLRHQNILLHDLKQLLKSHTATDEERKSALALAGLLGLKDLQDEIRTCWELTIDKTQVFQEVMYIVARYYGDVSRKILHPVMDYWAAIPDDENARDGYSRKSWFSERLRIAFSKDISKDAINYFIECSNTHKSLQWCITGMLQLVNEPNAVEYVVRNIAEAEKANNAESFSTYTTIYFNNWNQLIHKNQRLSASSLARLQELWENLDNDNFLRRIAFGLWRTNAESEYINVLTNISANSLLYESALWERAKLGDYSILAELSSLLSIDTRWFNVAHRVWCRELVSSVERCLENLEDTIPTDFSGGNSFDHLCVAQFFMRISKQDAEDLLSKYWNFLMYSPPFVQAALCIGTKKLLRLAEESIYQCPKDIKILEYIDHHWEFREPGEPKLLDEKQLNNLLPYIDRLGASVRGCAETCQKIGIPYWSQKNLFDWLEPDVQKRYHPSHHDLLQDLNEFLVDKLWEWHITEWLEGFDKRLDPPSRLLNLLDEWLAVNHTTAGLRITAACLKIMGTRKDSSILEKYEIEGLSNDIAAIKASTRFAVYRRSID